MTFARKPRLSRFLMIGLLAIPIMAFEPFAATRAQAPEPDANAYWAEIRDSADPADFEDFLKRFPDHAFASFARAKLSELRPETAAEPPAGPAPARRAVAPAPVNPQSNIGAPAPSPGLAATGGDLATSLQLALQEIGCYTGGIDGDWGRGSQSALQRFNALAGVKLPVGAPSQQALDAVSGWQGGKCAALAKKAAPKATTKKRTSGKRATKKKTASSRKKQPSRGGGVGVSIGIGGVGIGF